MRKLRLSACLAVCLAASLPALASAAADPCLKLVEAGAQTKALECYRTRAEKNPADLESRNAYAALLVEKRDYRGAIAAFDAVLAKDPKNGIAKNGKAMSLFVLKRYDEGFALLESALADDPNNIQVLQNVAVLAIETRKLDVAEGTFRRVISLDAKHAGAHLGLGETLMLKGKLDGARDSLHAAIKLDDKNARAHWLLGKVLAQADPKLAVQFLERASFLAPSDANVWFDLGLTRRLIGEHRLAGQALTQAMKYAPDDPRVYLELAKVHTDMNRFDMADAHFEEALKLKPAPILKADIHYHYGLLREQEVNYKAAEAQYLQALRSNPDDLRSLLNLSRIQAGQRRFDDARQLLDRAAKLAPENPAVRYNLAAVMIQQGEVDAGKLELKKLIASLPPTDPLRGQAEEVLRGARPGTIPSGSATKKP